MTCSPLPFSPDVEVYDLGAINNFIVSQSSNVLSFYARILKSVKSSDIEPPPLTQFKMNQRIPQERDINDLIALRMADYATLMQLVFRPAYEDVYEKAEFEF